MEMGDILIFLPFMMAMNLSVLPFQFTMKEPFISADVHQHRGTRDGKREPTEPEKYMNTWHIRSIMPASTRMEVLPVELV